MIQKQSIPSLEQALSGTLYGNVERDSKEVVMLDPSELIEIEDQPFRPYNPEKLQEMAEDIKENGQFNPCTVRRKDGQYIILAGRNRKRACEIASVKVACIIIECDDATANLILVNSNLNQRQELLPSEKAFAYKLQKESYEAKGLRKTVAAVAEQNSENVKMIQRYIRLTELHPRLMEMVDSDKLPVMVGVELSYLSQPEMNEVFSYLVTHNVAMSIAQAQEIHQMTPFVTYDQLNQILSPGNSDRAQPDHGSGKGEVKERKPITSISLKIVDLEGLGLDFDFESATKSEIKDFIIRSLDRMP
jgi:ParB family transcriptional regulator, chromosome partitioning protein